MEECVANLTPPSVDNDEDIPKVLTGWPNLLQLTAATFLIPSFMCIFLHKPVGTAVYGFNAACSVYAHRPDRTSVDTWTDTLDLIMVALWVVYNSYVVIKAKFKLHHTAIALTLAALVLFTKVLTKLLKYRSPDRYLVHAIMHLSGSLGSIFILV